MKNHAEKTKEVAEKLAGARTQDELAGAVKEMMESTLDMLEDLRNARYALAAVLLFHGAGPWDEQKRAAWAKFTRGRPDATTRALCDTVREALGIVDVDEMVH